MKINPNTINKLIKKGAILIDVRSPVEFAKGSVPNAVNIPLRNISKLLQMDKKLPFVLFGLSDDDQDLEKSVNYAIQMGLEVYNAGEIKNLL